MMKIKLYFFKALEKLKSVNEIGKIRLIINNQDLYKQYFIESPYIETETEHFYVGEPNNCPVAVCVDCYKFPPDYLKRNFLEAFVLSSVLNFYYGEEIKESWNISKQKRKELMDEDHILKWYAESCYFIQNNPTVRKVKEKEKNNFFLLLDGILKLNKTDSEVSNKIKEKLRHKKLIYLKSFGENFPVVIVALSDDEIVFVDLYFCD